MLNITQKDMDVLMKKFLQEAVTAQTPTLVP